MKSPCFKALGEHQKVRDAARFNRHFDFFLIFIDSLTYSPCFLFLPLPSAAAQLNHFPGTFQIGRKDRLWRNLSKMQLSFGKREFGFFPRTFVLPQDVKLLRKAWEDGGARQKWIVKPVGSGKKRGFGLRPRREVGFIEMSVGLFLGIIVMLRECFTWLDPRSQRTDANCAKNSPLSPQVEIFKTKKFAPCRVMSIYIYICIYVCVCIYIYVCVCVCICMPVYIYNVCVCVYIYIYYINVINTMFRSLWDVLNKYKAEIVVSSS